MDMSDCEKTRIQSIQIVIYVPNSRAWRSSSTCRWLVMICQLGKTISVCSSLFPFSPPFFSFPFFFFFFFFFLFFSLFLSLFFSLFFFLDTGLGKTVIHVARPGRKIFL